MAGVNGVDIKVGQVWRTREGAEATVESIDDHPDFPINLRFADYGGNCGKNGKNWGDIGETEDSPYDLIELVTDEQGFTIWCGGAQPPDAVGKLVRYRLNNGAILYGPFTADQRIWTHSGADDITAYKVVEAAAQPAPSTPDSASLAEETLSALGWVFDGTTWVEQPRIEMIPGGIPIMAVPGYELLSDVLHRAYNQAAIGKGKERHANGEPFDEQVMQDGARRFGVGALLFQAFKKSEESQRLPLGRGVNELLGAIVYLAGAVIRREADAAEGGA